MKIHIEGNLLVITFGHKNKCYNDKIVLRRAAIAGFSTNYGDETLKIILEGAEPIWLYFADSSAGDDALEAATAKLQAFLSAP